MISFIKHNVYSDICCLEDRLMGRHFILRNEDKIINCLCRYYLRISVKILLFETKFSHARSSCAFWSLSALCPFFGKLFTWELDYGVAMHLNLARGNTAFHWKKIMGPPECNRSRDWKTVHQIRVKKGLPRKLIDMKMFAKVPFHNSFLEQFYCVYITFTKCFVS